MGVVALSSVWPQPVPYQLIPYIEVDALQAAFGGRLLPWVLWLSPEQQDYYVRDWKPVWMRPEKSRAYALQWFSFALVALVFFIIMNFETRFSQCIQITQLEGNVLQNVKVLPERGIMLS